jgi:cell division protein FtsW
MSSFLSPRSDNPFVRWWLSIDKLSFCLLLILALFGVVMVATASPSVAVRIGLDGYHFLLRHLLFLVPTIGILVILAFADIRNIKRFAFLLFVGATIGVILSLSSGYEIKGATRWIRVLGFSIQPSEFIKPGFIVLSAILLSMQHKATSIPNVIIALCLYIVTAGLLISQPDFGMVFLISVVFAMQIFIAGCPLRYVALLAIVGVAGVLIAYVSLGHVQSRIDRFLFPEGADTYQIDQSKQAFVNGGLIGVGPGQGSVKNTVPDVHSDFIFTAVGEEWGFLLTSLFVGIFGLILYRFFTHFTRSDNLFVLLAGSGLTFMIVVQCFIHMGSAMQLIPAKGMTLPLISYGGSSMIAAGITFGLILALSRGINEDRKRSTWRHLLRKEH